MLRIALTFSTLVAFQAQAKPKDWHMHEAKLAYSCDTVRAAAAAVTRKKLEALAIEYGITPAMRRQAEKCFE